LPGGQQVNESRNPSRDGILLRAEPPIRPLGAPVAAAAGQMVDAAVSGQHGAKGVLALDLAAWRHEGVIGKELPAGIGRAIWPEPDGRVLVPPATVGRRHEASLPHAEAVLFGIALVNLVPAVGIALEIERPTVPHQPLVEVEAIHRASADAA